MAWTDSVDHVGNCLTKFNDDAPFGNIIFWIKTSCNEEAIKILTEKGQLPLRYKWFQRIGASWVPKGITYPFGNYTIDQSTADSTLTNKTIVTWTKVGKNDLRRGKLKVSIRLPDDTLITEAIIKIN